MNHHDTAGQQVLYGIRVAGKRKSAEPNVVRAAPITELPICTRANVMKRVIKILFCLFQTTNRKKKKTFLWVRI